MSQTGSSNAGMVSETMRATTGASNYAVATTCDGAPQRSSRDDEPNYTHTNEPPHDTENVEQIQKELYQLNQEYEQLNRREQQLQQAYDILQEEEACLARGILVYLGQEQHVEKQTVGGGIAATTKSNSAEVTARATDDNVSHEAQAIRRLEQALLACSSSSSSDDDNDEDENNGKLGNDQDDP